jgi:glycoprotein endo-alpha-1,2-mannosidase
MIPQAMPRLLLCVIAALALPAAAVSASSPSAAPQLDARVVAFYYPWYGTPALEGMYEHWSQDGHVPPDDIASSYYPARGLYSSSDKLVLAAQMNEIRAAGIGEIAVSWWGRGTPEDQRLPAVIVAARTDGIQVAVHLEPYAGRTVDSTVADVTYLRTLGIKTFYVYQALDLPVADWKAAMPRLQQGGTVLLAQTALVGAAAAAGFNGVYTYDILTYGGDKFARLCNEAHARHLLCAPSVGPGYLARRGDGDPRVKPRRNGGTYDHMWAAAIHAHADIVTITSYNEWHEGTQIEPAAPPARHGAYRYLSYNGAWGLYGVPAETAYLQRTAYWANVYRKTLELQPNRSAP